ncbi:hypothetical protein [Kitasatospora sp. NPDC059571]|uniref:hypothetical protein n=1 Tax=Kitasatospora sp. NPDC059571 TaxID=3346871 RepID=UPI003697A5B3
MSMGARPADWSVLGLSSDPVPGDLDQLAATANRLNQVADLAGRLDALVQAAFRSVADGGFVGQTADALRGKMDALVPQYVAAIASAFGQAAAAVDDFRSALAEQQPRADAALAGASALGPTPDGTDPARSAAWQESMTRFREQAREAAAEADAAASAAAAAVRDATAAAPEFRDGSSCWDTFWTVVGWIATAVTIPALIFGGPLGLMAWGLGAAQFVKAGVDLAEGRSTVGDFLLAGLGILAPSTKPLLGLEQVSRLATSAAGAAKAVLTTGTDGVISLVKATSEIGHGLLEAPLSTLANLAQTTVMVPATVVWRGRDLILNGLRLTPDYLGRIGAGLIDTAHALPAAAWEQLRDWRWIGVFLPVTANEIKAYGVAGAFGKGILERGLGFSSHSASLASDVLTGAAHGADSALRLRPGDTALGGGGPLKLTDHGLLVPSDTAAWDGTGYTSGPSGLLLPDHPADVGKAEPSSDIAFADQGLAKQDRSPLGDASFSASADTLVDLGQGIGPDKATPLAVPHHLTHPVVFTVRVPAPAPEGAGALTGAADMSGVHWPTPDPTRPGSPDVARTPPVPGAPTGATDVPGLHWPTPDPTRPGSPAKGHAPGRAESVPWGGSVVQHVADVHRPVALPVDLNDAGLVPPLRRADEAVVHAPPGILGGSDDQVRKHLIGLAKDRIGQVEKEISDGVRDTLPGAFSAGVDRASGRIFFGESGSAEGLADSVLAALPQESLHPAGRPPGVCAEGRMCTSAINGGADPSDLYIITVNARGKKFKMCVNCASWVPDFVGKVLTG